MSQEKKSADYTSGTYFIHPRIIEEMRQAQRQKRQMAREQGGVPAEPHPDLTTTKVLDPTGEQKKHRAPDHAGTQSGHINTAHIQPT